MITEALAGLVTLLAPAAGVSLYKAIRVEKEVETHKEKLDYIVQRVDSIFDFLLTKGAQK